MNQHHQWEQVIASIIFFESVSDAKQTSQSHLAIPTFKCETCSAVFSNSRALSCHYRMSHGVCDPVKHFVASNSCPVCLATFSCRLSVLKHLADARRPKCRIRLLSGEFPRIPDELCAELDDKDREEKKIANRNGHSHVLSTKPAVAFNGRILGCSSNSVIR